MGLFDKFSGRKRVLRTDNDVYPPSHVPGSKVLRACIEGIDDPSADPWSWSSAWPETSDPYGTWRVRGSNGEYFDVSGKEVMGVLVQGCSVETAHNIVQTLTKGLAELEEEVRKKRQKETKAQRKLAMDMWAHEQMKNRKK